MHDIVNSIERATLLSEKNMSVTRHEIRAKNAFSVKQFYQKKSKIDKI